MAGQPSKAFCNHGHILRLFDFLPNSLLTTSETTHGY